MLTLFLRGVMCNWMVSMGVVGAMMSDSLPGKVIAMWMPIMVFFYLGFEHSIVNMFLFPSGLLLGGEFTVVDYLVWNEIPTVLGNLVSGAGLRRVGHLRHARPDGAVAAATRRSGLGGSGSGAEQDLIVGGLAVSAHPGRESDPDQRDPALHTAGPGTVPVNGMPISAAATGAIPVSRPARPVPNALTHSTRG